MRSLLFVPGHDARKLEKGLTCGADALILDLEDAVPEAEKPRAREVCAAFLSQHRHTHRLIVRVNALNSGHLLDDLAAVVGAAPWGIMLPKCESVADLSRVDAYLSALEVREGLDSGGLRVLPIVTENAVAVLGMSGYAREENRRLCGMLWGGEDLATDVGVLNNRTPQGTYTALFQMARAMTLLSATTSRVMAVDAVYTDFRDAEGLRAEALEARRDGFTAKAAIHPAQVSIINEVFSPSDEEVAWSRQVIAAFAASPQAGSISIDGKMLDRPHYLAAKRVLEQSDGISRV